MAYHQDDSKDEELRELNHRFQEFYYRCEESGGPGFPDWSRRPEQGIPTLWSQESPLTQQQQQRDRLAAVVASYQWPSRGGFEYTTTLPSQLEGDKEHGWLVRAGETPGVSPAETYRNARDPHGADLLQPGFVELQRLRHVTAEQWHQQVDASTASPAVEEPKEMPNARYTPGMVLECVGQLLMRQQEDLESPQVARLPQKSLVKVLEIGTGPSGKRIKVHAASGEEGWASVIASNTAPMFRSTERPFALETAPVAVAAVPEAAVPVEPAATATAEPVASAPSATVSEMPWSSIRPGDTCVCTTTVVMRRDEDTNSELMWRLPVGEELEILKSGTEPTGRRFMAKDSKGNKGWISAFSKEGHVLLEVTQRGTQSLFVGAGQALGGDADRGPEAAATDRRAAALAAAEKRQVRQPAEKSNKVCFAYMAGKCASGCQCHDKHPDEASCQKIKERYGKTDCQWGRQCRREGCLYRHPSDEPVGRAHTLQLQPQQAVTRMHKTAERYKFTTYIVFFKILTV